MNFKYYKSGSLIPFIAILSIVCSLVYSWLEQILAANGTFKNISNYISFFSVLGLMVILIKWINVCLWKYKFTNVLIDVPNLNGRYEGEMVSSYPDQNGNPIKLICAMEVTQNASQIHVYTYVGNELGIQSSHSSTICEELIMQKNKFYRLFYNFQNESEQSTNLSDHKGTAYLDVFLDTKSLTGRYFNERGNSGSINVKFVSTRKIGRLNG